jgi:hypothetical protein
MQPCLVTALKHPYWMAPTTATDEEAWDNYFAFNRALVQWFLIHLINHYNDFRDISKKISMLVEVQMDPKYQADPFVRSN